MAADWEEIRRLAADFQRAQFADTVQRLSERNCIEIVAKLIAEKQIDVVHTLDGKEYITPSQISREIRDELYVHGGRVNIVDLQQITNVDLVHVESRASDIAKSDKSIQLVLGQLIDENYLDQLAEEVNDRLQEAGQVTIAELCKSYDLPGDFLTEALSQRLGRIIHGQMDQYDRGVIFTQAFVSRHRARIRGLFSAITRPTPVSNLITQYGFQEHLLYSVLEDFVNSGRLKGSVVGGRQDKAVYIPDIYSKTQNNWIDAFLKQNGYLEFDALTRLGIPDPTSYIKKRYKSSKLLFLRAACVGQSIVDQVEASVEEAVNSGTWTDVQSMLPSCLSLEDTGILLNQVMRTSNIQSSARTFSDTIVISEKFISSCTSLFDPLMRGKAEKEIKSNPVFLITEDELKQASVVVENAAFSKKDKRGERKKKASEGSGSVKGGGGGNAREIRIRKTKKKGRQDDDSDDETTTTTQNRSKQQEVPFMTQGDIEEVLQKHVQDCPEEMLSELAEHLIRPLTKMYQEVVRSVFMSSTSSSTGASRKQTVKDLQEEITNLFNNIRLFEKGTKLFSDETQANIAKHVLKTVCTDITNLLFNFLGAELMMAVENYNSITNEVRIKILGKLPEETKGPLTKLHNSLNAKSLEEFLTNLDSVAEVCGIMLKKGDKKRERQALFQHRQALIEQLKVTEDPALVLHLTSILLFQFSTNCMLHAPGRCVPQIIAALSTRIPEDQHKLLSKYQGLVVKQLVGQNRKASQTGEDSEEKQQAEEDTPDAVRKELLSLTSEVKDLALRPRKTSLTEE
ncbi:E3 UFM1-protein ligase 1-like [Acipenser oxyrinchus oxyrinchus]|uniref:E3 UFM1-protein ligase 1 n=1 Tax=Acipenser oxyrinchus oxyrinchus TaxID=40147 RepID=A0AAD8LQS7_ACIOX|nr:E3 UFM1-protein ligase 1-like [Acipenser oxyrinchus oxyrinchus]